MNLSFKTFDISNNERLKAKKIQGKKYEIFLNENEQSLITPKISFREILRYYYLYSKNAIPSFKLPFLKPDLNDFNTPHITWLAFFTFCKFKEYKILMDPVLTLMLRLFLLSTRLLKMHLFNANDLMKFLL